MNQTSGENRFHSVELKLKLIVFSKSNFKIKQIQKYYSRRRVSQVQRLASLKGVRYIFNSGFSRNPTFYNFIDELSYVCISDQKVESYVSLQVGVSISANDGPSTVLRQAITAALSSLACKIKIRFISRTVELQSRAMAYFDRRTQDFKMTKRF